MRQRQKESESIPKFGSFAPESICFPGFELGEATSFRLYLDPCQSQMNSNPSCLCRPCYQQKFPLKINSNGGLFMLFI